MKRSSRWRNGRSAIAQAVWLYALATSAMTAQAMDLLQVFDAAQQNDAMVLAARATAEAERERLPQAKAQLMPSLSASMSSTNNHLESETPNFLGTVQTNLTNYPSSTKYLTLRQPLYRKQLSAQYQQAQAQVDDAEASLKQEEQNLTVRVTGAYLDALLAQDQLGMVLSQQRAYITQLDAAKRFFAAGTGTRTDIDDMQARLDMNKAQELEARQNVAYTRQQLQTLINQPVEQLAELDAAKLQLRDPQPNHLQDWIDRAEANSSMLKSLQARVETARQEAEKARAGHLPTLDAVAQWSDSKSESVTNTSSRYTNTTLGLQLNVPLYAGGYVSSQVRQSLALITRAEQNLEAGRRDLGMRVYKEFRGMTENIAKIRALEQALRSADQMVVSSNKSVLAGSRSLIDVANAEQQRSMVLRDLAQARYMYLIAEVRLLALVDGVDRDWLANLNLAFNS